jgi:hypothetical protein
MFLRFPVAGLFAMLAACAATSRAPPDVDRGNLPPVIVEPLIVPPLPIEPRFIRPGQAIDAVLAVHPELRLWRSLTIPPQSIQAVRYQPGAWLVGFVRTNGNDILAARCFRVLANGEVVRSGAFTAQTGESIANIDVGACRPDPEGRASRDDSRAPGIGWQVNGRSAYFHAAATSQYDLAIMCDPGYPASLFLYTAAGQPGPAVIQLRSGDQMLAAAAVAREMRASQPPVGRPAAAEPVVGMEVRAQVAFSSPLMQRFLTTGRLAVTGLGKTVTADAAELERRALQALAAACR